MPELRAVTPDLLEARFRSAVVTPSDINEHLEILRELAMKCEHVTEMGMRGANGSTIALLAGQPESFISWDINPYAIVSQAVADLLPMVGRTRFQPRVGSTLEIDIEPTDLLFIDTLHTGVQLRGELARHGKKVRRYIAFHDTATFGYVGEDGREGNGLRPVIRAFQQDIKGNGYWQLIHDFKNNNGLIVLERND